MTRQINAIKEVKKLLDSNLSEKWIDNLDWSDDEKSVESLKKGVGILETVQHRLFVILANIGLQGDHLRFDASKLDSLSEKCAIEVVEDDTNDIKAKLQSIYRELMDELKDAILLTKYYISFTQSFFQVRDNSRKVMNFIRLDALSKNNSSWVATLNVIFDVCLFEYRFSYNQSSLKELLINKDLLNRSKKLIVYKESESIIDLVINKIDFLLLKLSHFAENQRIEYQFNFEKSVVDPVYINPEKDYFYDKFLKFIEPQKNINKREAYEWQSHPHKKWPMVWQMVLLMRYYTKVTRDICQVENLLNEYENFYKEYCVDGVPSEFNRYASRSVRVYMHNCVLSFKCKRGNKYSFEDLKGDMNRICTILNECFIYNYHPFQKAIEYTIESLKKDIVNKSGKESLLEKMKYLKEWQERYHENIEWCAQNQCYAFQLTFFECTRFIKPDNVRVFHPSSFSRPLKFPEIRKKMDRLDAEIIRLEHDVERYDDVLELKEAQAKVENMERKNMETMGLFISLTTFLVGLLSIFIGNNGDVSIVDKMQYVIMLGTVLLLFVCLDYFVIGSALNKWKPWIFGGIAVILLIMMFVYYCILPSKVNMVSQIKSNPTQSKRTTIISAESDVSAYRAMGGNVKYPLMGYSCVHLDNLII